MMSSRPLRTPPFQQILDPTLYLSTPSLPDNPPPPKNKTKQKTKITKKIK